MAYPVDEQDMQDRVRVKLHAATSRKFPGTAENWIEYPAGETAGYLWLEKYEQIGPGYYGILDNKETNREG